MQAAAKGTNWLDSAGTYVSAQTLAAGALVQLAPQVGYREVGILIGAPIARGAAFAGVGVSLAQVGNAWFNPSVSVGQAAITTIDASVDAGLGKLGLLGAGLAFGFDQVGGSRAFAQAALIQGLADALGTAAQQCAMGQ